MRASVWKRTKRGCALVTRVCAHVALRVLQGLGWCTRKIGKASEEFALDELDRNPPSWRSYALLSVVLAVVGLALTFCVGGA